MERIGYKCVGLNHFGWYTKIWDKETGEDLYPKLREGDRKGSPLAHWDEYAMMRTMFRVYGLWPYPGTNHIGEYMAWSDGFLASALPQFYFDPLVDDPWGTRRPPEFVYSIDYHPTGHLPFPEKKNENEPREAELAKGEYEKAFDPEGEIEGSGEYGIPIAEAIFFDEPAEFAALNLPNDGSAADLPVGMVIEAGARADGKGIHLLPCDPLPRAAAQMIAVQGTIHKLVIEAYAEKSRLKLLQAVLLDPTVSSYHNAVCMINEMCELQKDALPEMHW
jgi:alpha-galactosidase